MEFLRSLDTCSFFPEHFIGARHLGLFLLTSEKLVFVKKCIGLKHHLFSWNEVQFNSIAHACPTLCNPMDCSTSGFPVHQLLELAQTHVHRVGDAIQPSYSLSSPSPPAFNLSQNQGLLQRVSSHQVAKVLEFQFQYQSSH